MHNGSQIKHYFEDVKELLKKNWFVEATNLGNKVARKIVSQPAFPLLLHKIHKMASNRTLITKYNELETATMLEIKQ